MLRIKILISKFFQNFFGTFLSNILLTQPSIMGNKKRIHMSEKSNINNAILNVNSGEIFIKDYVFFGHSVMILTGTHDYNKFNLERMHDFPKNGNDIVINNGVWIGSGAIILGPCVIGENSVIAAGSIVLPHTNIPSNVIFGGNPAKELKKITQIN